MVVHDRTPTETPASRRGTALTSEKTAVVGPMPSAKANTATVENPEFWRASAPHIDDLVGV
jgi:hypothetical protein